MTAISRNAVNTGARGILSGTISNGASWYEDIEITENGTVIASADTWDWTLTFRDPEIDDSAVLTLTTDDDLIISQGSDSTTVQIRVAKADISALEGEYVVDLKSLDTSDTTYDSAGKSIHWAHGRVTVLAEP